MKTATIPSRRKPATRFFDCDYDNWVGFAGCGIKKNITLRSGEMVSQKQKVNRFLDRKLTQP